MAPPVRCEQLCCLLACLSTLAAGVDEIFAAGCIWDCISVQKLCYKPRELYSSVSLSFPVLCFSPGRVASPALGTITH